MKKTVAGSDPIVQTLRDVALRQADIEVGVACKGTALESTTFKVNGKAFLFLRPGNAMLKLDGSLQEASKLAAETPLCYKVGSGAWVTITLSNSKDLSTEVLARWIAESHGLCATAQKKPTKGRSSKK